MAALNRLSQRIKENFHETTRDLSLLTGGGGGSQATYFDTSDEKFKEISKLLESRAESERLEGMKRIIAGISKGRDMEGFFAQVVKNVVAPSIEIRKLVYIYLLRFATTNSDLLLLSINTFQKDLSDPSPLIRSMSLRVLTSIRVPVIQGIVMLGLKKLVTDRNPWVRKTVAGGLAKVYEVDPSTQPQLLALLSTLLASPSPLTLGASLTAFLEICPDNLAFLHPFYRHICRLLSDADEWGQMVALDVLTRYARVMLEKPDTAGAIPPTAASSSAAPTKKDGEDEDPFEGLDEDLAMLLHHAKPLFQSRNPAVVLAVAKMYFHLAPSDNSVVGQSVLVAPLLRLAGSASKEMAAGEEIAGLTWQVIEGMVEERPWLFARYHSRFFLHSEDATVVKVAKINSLRALLSEDNATASLREFKFYVRFSDDSVAQAAIQSIGQLIKIVPSLSQKGLAVLMRLLTSERGALVASAVLVLKSVILSGSKGLPDPSRLVARLAKSLDGVTNSSARASIFWLVGQFAAADDGIKMGLGWEGVASWVPDVLRRAIKGFAMEGSTAKLQILSLAAKIMVLSPGNSQLHILTSYLFNLARYDAEYDIRDRARFLHSLLRGLKPPSHENGDATPGSESDEEEMGGVVLRREQLRVILFGTRPPTEDSSGKQDYGVASMSRTIGKKLSGYADVPDWTDDPTDGSMRDSELEHAHLPPPPPSAAPSVPLASQEVRGSTTSMPSAIPPTLASTPGQSSSPAGSIPSFTSKNKQAQFKDLDAFLNSESEESSDESEDETTALAPRPVVAPPLRNDFVPEYDEDTSEEGSEEESEEESDDHR